MPFENNLSVTEQLQYLTLMLNLYISGLNIAFLGLYCSLCLCECV